MKVHDAYGAMFQALRLIADSSRSNTNVWRASCALHRIAHYLGEWVEREVSK